MEPRYTLFLCLPAVLGLIACACGLAVLWSPAARPTEFTRRGRGRAVRSRG